MKNVLMALGGLSLVCTASAQTSVTLYGAADAGVSYISNEQGKSATVMSSSIMRGDRWGFLGSEDLGGGYRAVFRLENGFAIENGTLGQGGLLFGRQAYVGLQNDWGTVTLGRQYDFVPDNLELFSAANIDTVYAFHPGDIDRVAGGTRVDSAVKFVSKTFAGFNFGMLYGFGDTSATGGSNTARTLSAGASYQRGNFAASIAYTSEYSFNADLAGGLGVNSVFGQKLAVVNPSTGAVTTKSAYINRLSTVGVGSSYRLDALTMKALVTGTHINTPAGSGWYMTYETSPEYQISPSLTVSAGYTFITFQGDHWGEASGAIDYRLSKRTDVYLMAENLRGYSAGTRAAIVTLSTSASNSQTVVRVGMRHYF